MNASDQVAMGHQYADSDYGVKRARCNQFRIASQGTAIVHGMAGQDPTSKKESEPVSEFIRMLIARWQGEGRTIKDLAKQAGLAQSMPSQIKARTSDATLYSARKLAGPLGYKDLPDLVSAAWLWWHSPDRSIVPESESEAPQAEAIRLAMLYGVTEEQIARVIARYPVQDFAHQDALWWLAKLHEARSEDAERAQARKVERGERASEDRKRRKTQAEIRNTKDQLEAVVPSPSPPRVSPPPKRRAG